MALLVCAALVANLTKLMALWDLPPANTGEMTQREQRLEPLRKVLPKRGPVGYVSDVSDPVELKVRMMLAQFSLAPVLVVPGSEHVPVVGDFSKPDAVDRPSDPHLTVLQDFGAGVVLFDRAQR